MAANCSRLVSFYLELDLLKERLAGEEGSASRLLEGDLKEDGGDEITVPAYCRADLLAERRGAVKPINPEKTLPSSSLYLRKSAG